jgi:uncharacterized membrane protein YtjA (UPF0391 family)
MRGFAITFFIGAVAAGIFGWLSAANLATEIAHVLFVVLFILFVFAVIASRQHPS